MSSLGQKGNSKKWKHGFNYVSKDSISTNNIFHNISLKYYDLQINKCTYMHVNAWTWSL